jgi:hypothetical protein
LDEAENGDGWEAQLSNHIVIPAKAGIQSTIDNHGVEACLGAGLRRHDGN